MYVSAFFIPPYMHACLQASRKRARKMLKAFSAGVHSPFFLLLLSFFKHAFLSPFLQFFLQSACDCAECRVHSLPLFHFYRSFSSLGFPHSFSLYFSFSRLRRVQLQAIFYCRKGGVEKGKRGLKEGKRGSEETDRETGDRMERRNALRGY